MGIFSLILSERRRGAGGAIFTDTSFFGWAREEESLGVGLFSPTLGERRRRGGGVIFTDTSFLGLGERGREGGGVIYTDTEREKKRRGRGYLH